MARRIDNYHEYAGQWLIPGSGMNAMPDGPKLQVEQIMEERKKGRDLTICVVNEILRKMRHDN